MRVPTLSRRAAGSIAAISIAVAIAHAGTESPQLEPSGGPFVAFRVDQRYAIAVVRVTSIRDVQQIRSNLSTDPAARYGFVQFDVPAEWESHRPKSFVPGDRWALHAGPGLVLAASAERVVGGELGCEQAFGVLLRVEDEREFSANPAKYFVAEYGMPPSHPPVPATLGAVRVSEPLRTGIERALDDVLRQGLRAQEQEEGREKLPEGIRDWLKTRRAIDAAMTAGRGKLTYDVQPFRLGPDRAQQYFVRARWMVGSKIGFAASVWFRDAGDGTLVVFANDPRPASFLRMREFRGEISTEQQGLVLNVVDRDGDGLAEVVMAFGGYEGMHISLRKYTGSGFEDTGIGYSFGC